MKKLDYCELKRGNALIEKYMGTFIEDSFGLFFEGFFKSEKCKNDTYYFENGTRGLKGLPFDERWSLLIPVVAKIEVDNKYGKYEKEQVKKTGIRRGVNVYANSITSTWKEAVKFIEWRMKQK